MRDALLVGIDQYADAPLRACVTDVHDMAACLALEQYDFNCRTLTDKSATRSNVLSALAELAYDDGERDFLLFYFAGHGEVVGRAGHLVTVDAELHDPGISLAHLAQLMESASDRYRHVVAILDCCHAGSAFTWTMARPLRPDDVDRELPSVNESRCVLAACRPEQTADEFKGAAHGVFTKALLDGLLGGAVDFDGQVTLLGLHEYAIKAIAEESQTPVFKGDVAGTVVLGTKFEPRRGAPIDSAEMSKVLARGQALVDEYYALQQNELPSRNSRTSSGYKTCAQALLMRLTWFKDTQQSLPDLGRNPIWQELVRRMNDFRKDLASLEVGLTTPFGLVDGHLGHGGYGHVWSLAADDGTKLALKVFHGNELDDEVKVARFRNGYLSMKGLEHPRIVRVREMHESPYAFAMDLIPGENLRELHIARDNPEVILRLLVEIAETVQSAHLGGVRHRDIKPENIVVVTNDDGGLIPYLTDFDLAYHETNRTVTTNLGVGGVINYAAPEQLFEPNTANARADTVDIFSLAQLMFFVLVGRDPSGERFSKNEAQLVRALNEWIDDRAASALIDLYKRSTAKDPSKRPQSMVEVIQAISRAEVVIIAASGNDIVDEDAVCRRVAHLYAGIGRFHATQRQAQMSSLSGQVDIVVRLKGVQVKKQTDTAEIELELSVTGKIPVPFLKSGVDARTALNTRLDKILKRYPDVTRHPGHKGAYQVFINIRNVPFSQDGVSKINDVLVSGVAAIEQW